MPNGSIPLNISIGGGVSSSTFASGEQTDASQSSYGYIDPTSRVDNSLHRNILTVSKYAFLRDAYSGAGGFFSGYYLVPFITETMYVERRELATYKNFLRPIVDAMVNPIFSTPIRRDCKAESGIILENSMYQEFSADCDNAGNTLDSQLKENAIESVLQGNSYIVMDNSSDTSMYDTEADAISARAYPYVYIMKSCDVKKYELDRFGNIENIIFNDTPETVIDVDGRKKTVCRFKFWDKNVSILMQEVRVQEGGGEVTKLVPVQPPVVHGLGFVPVYPMFWSKRCRGSLDVESSLYEIAKLCWGIFNLDSERREVERHQGFSMLCIQGQPSTNIGVGAGNVLWYDAEAKNAPSYASPSADIIRALREETDDMTQRLFQMADQNGVSASQGGGVKNTESGYAKEWDFRAHEFILLSVSSMIKRAEAWILKAFNAYTKTNIICNCHYPENFAPSSKGDNIKNLDALLLMDVSPLANKYIKKQAFRATFPDASDDVLALIDEEIDSVEIPIAGGLISDLPLVTDKEEKV